MTVLWQAVVAQAVADVANQGSSEPVKQNAREAALWLFSPLQEKYLAEVCAMAGLRVEQVRRVARAAQRDHSIVWSIKTAIARGRERGE